MPIRSGRLPLHCGFAKVKSSSITGTAMKFPIPHSKQEGKVGWILLWLIGVPIPVLLILFLLRGCT
jgi:hypothetical protein